MTSSSSLSPYLIHLTHSWLSYFSEIIKLFMTLQLKKCTGSSSPIDKNKNFSQISMALHILFAYHVLLHLTKSTYLSFKTQLWNLFLTSVICQAESMSFFSKVSMYLSWILSYHYLSIGIFHQSVNYLIQEALYYSPSFFPQHGVGVQSIFIIWVIVIDITEY